MAIIKIRDVGDLGVVTDLPDHELPPNAFSRAQNMSFREASAYRVKGYDAAQFPAITLDPYFIHAAPGPSDNSWVWAGLTKIHGIHNGVDQDMTRTVGGDYTGAADDAWNGCNLNGVTILNNGVDDPQFCIEINASDTFEDLTNWPANFKAKVIRPYKNFLMALNVTESATKKPTTVRWSDAADPGTVPSSWDITDATKLTGDLSLAESPGAIVDGLTLQDRFIVYKTDSTHALQHVEGNEIMRHDVIDTKVGIAGQDCVVEFQSGLHLLFTQNGDLMINNGQSIKSITTKRVRKLILSNIGESNIGRSFMIVNRRLNEVWLCIPTTGSDWPNKVITWNFAENTFGEFDIPEIASMASGPYEAAANPSAWSDLTADAWDSYVGNWDGSSAINVADRIAGADIVNQKLLLHDESYGAATVDMECFVERLGLSIVAQDVKGEITSDPTAIKLVTKVWPLIETASNIDFEIRVGQQNYKDGPVTWQGPFTFNPQTDTFIQPYLEGKLLGYRISQTGQTGWKLIGLDVEIDVVGDTIL